MWIYLFTGIEISEYLSLRTFIGKIFGFIAAYSAGFSIGKEGPYVHMCSSLCSLLSRIPIFRQLRNVLSSSISYY